MLTACFWCRRFCYSIFRIWSLRDFEQRFECQVYIWKLSCSRR